jgi:hypothetical protein
VRSVHKNEFGPHSDIALEASLSVVRRVLRSQERVLPERRQVRFPHSLARWPAATSVARSYVNVIAGAVLLSLRADLRQP